MFKLHEVMKVRCGFDKCVSGTCPFEHCIVVWMS